MSEVMRSANVYFLPAVPAVVESPRRPSPWRRLRATLRGELWRLRFALAGFRMALRRPRTALFDDEALGVYGEQRAQLIERRPRLAPARIIDFGSARARLRPLAATR
ncbi:MAG TPA: hypothetical protein VHZ49_11070 [Methylomirabilota bacterium]|jgi:hypothetical protein|nr:hypothetical protein [Methylomirabilota bacterium]